MKLRTLFKLHQTLAIVVVLQVIIWLLTALFLNLADKSWINGRSYYRPMPVYSLSQLTSNTLAELPLSVQEKAVAIELTSLLSKPVYQVYQQKGLYPHFAKQVSLYDAQTLEPIDIEQSLAQQIALASYSGNGKVEKVSLIPAPYRDFTKQRNDAWQVVVADDKGTRIYVEANAGRLIGHVNTGKRLANFMLMLHFMDYAGEGSFNNIFIRIFGLITLLFVVTGALLVHRQWQGKQYKMN